MKILAVVVTFNRLEMLMRTLDALENQTEPVEVLVVDNASTDGTRDYLASTSYPARILRSKQNIGGAGGFASGMGEAMNQDPEYLWLMDDDTVPEPDAARRLLRALENHEEAAFACSNVLWTDGSICEMNVPTPAWDWSRRVNSPEGLVYVDTCSFVSVLVRASAVRVVGIPIAEYFIWHDDVEYTMRLTRRFGPGVFVSESQVTHLLPMNRGVNFGDLNSSNLWKFGYGVRNTIWTAKLHKKPHLIVELAERMFKQFRGSKVPLRLRFALWRRFSVGLLVRPPRPINAWPPH